MGMVQATRPSRTSEDVAALDRDCDSEELQMTSLIVLRYQAFKISRRVYNQRLMQRFHLITIVSFHELHRQHD